MAAPEFERHTLLHVSLAGRERIFADLADKGYDEEALGEMFLPERFPGGDEVTVPIPGIARREEFAPRAGFIPVGFASWRSNECGRLRVGTFAAPGEVLAFVSPEEVAAKADYMEKERMNRTPALAALARLRAGWDGSPLSLGVWGSAAMEIETGRFYTHQWSDLDVRILPGGNVTKDALRQCLDLLLAAEKKHGIRIDAELRVAGGYGVSLKELLSNSATALGKGLTDVVLLEKTEVFAGLAG